MANNLNKNKDNWWRCNHCEKILGEHIDDYVGIIEIMGPKGQKYEIAYDYIFLVCRKCGVQNYLERASHLAASPFDGTPYFIPIREYPMVPKPIYKLSDYHRNLLLKELSQKGKEIYKIIENLKNNPYAKDMLAMISKKVGLPEKVVISHIQEITRLIGQIRKKNSKKNR